MSYTALASIGIIAAVLVDLTVLRTRLVLTKTFWLSYAIIVAFQLLVNGVPTGLSIVRYNPATILGVRLAYAPIEDIAFGFAMTVLTLAWWVWLGRRSGTETPSGRQPRRPTRGTPTTSARRAASRLGVGGRCGVSVGRGRGV